MTAAALRALRDRAHAVVDRDSHVWRPANGSPACALSAGFYARPTLEVARDLLGKVLVHAGPDEPTGGLIVEVEAYVGESDPACHAAVGLTPRNAPLYGPPGFAYLYLNYGMHVLVNAVTEREGFPAAVLIRALDPVLGVDRMRERRGRVARGESPVGLCRGPGRLSQALGLTLALNRTSLEGPRLTIADVGIEPVAVAWTTRVGIRVGTDHPWRAHVSSSPCVSPWRRGGRQRVRVPRSQSPGGSKRLADVRPC